MKERKSDGKLRTSCTGLNGRRLRRRRHRRRMNNIYDLDAPIIQIHGLFMIILSNI